MNNIKKGTKRTIFSAGYYYDNNWVVVGRGLSKKEAKENLESSVKDPELVRGLRYVETTYEQTYCSDRGWVNG